MGTRNGAIKRAAKGLGITLKEYNKKTRNGKKRCTTCKAWKRRAAFAKDSSRGDKLNTRCRECKREKNPKKPIMPEWAKHALRKRNRENKWRTGIPLSTAHKKHLSYCRKKEGKNGTGIFYGSNNPNWKGGVTPENHRFRNCADYSTWREAVFKRDKYICQKCGDKKGGNLEAHHLKSWKDHKNLRYIVSNGLTVCIPCHTKIHYKPDSYRNRTKKRWLKPINSFPGFIPV